METSLTKKRSDIVRTGNEMRDWRLSLSVSQDKVAEEFWCTRQTIARLEQRADVQLPREWQYAITLLKIHPELMGGEFGNEHRSRGVR